MGVCIDMIVIDSDKDMQDYETMIIHQGLRLYWVNLVCHKKV